MTTALEAAERHLAALAENALPANEKPSAFHYGLITTLVAELKRANAHVSQLHKDMREQEREFQREARDIAAEAMWAERERNDERY